MPDQPPRPRFPFRLIAAVVIGLVRLLRWRIHTRGLGNIPACGGAVITWNHVSHVDFVMTAWDIYRRLDRPVRFMAIRELWRSPVWWWLPRVAGAIPVERSTVAGRRRAYEAAVAALRSGHLVLVAPEGRISPTGELLEFRTGAVRMAQRAGVPVVPSASRGTRRLSTTGRPLRLRAAIGLTVDVAFGPPMTVAPDRDPTAATAELRDATSQLLERLREDRADRPG